MNDSLISVIVPVYNVEDYLRRCLDSIINQTYKNLEIILVDDGSTDKSGEICEEYKKRDNRIIVIHQKNQGVSAARNAGLDIFKGEYVSFIDSDDYVDLRFIEELYFNLIQYETDISVCGMHIIHLNNKPAILNNLPKGICTTIQYFENIFYPCLNKLFRGFLLKENRFTPGRIFSEDAELVYRLLAKSRKVSATATPLYYYSHRCDSASKLNNKTYDFFYLDLDFLSKRLIYFSDDLTDREVNRFYREAFRFLLNAKKHKNILFKNEGMESYRMMLSVVKDKLSFSSKCIIKLPRTYLILRKLLHPLILLMRKISI